MVTYTSDFYVFFSVVFMQQQTWESIGEVVFRSSSCEPG